MASSQLAVLDQKSDSNKCWAKTKCKELFLNQSYPVILAVGLLEKISKEKGDFYQETLYSKTVAVYWKTIIYKYGHL